MEHARLFQKAALAMLLAKNRVDERSIKRAARRALKVSGGPFPYMPTGLVDPLTHTHTKDQPPIAWQRCNIEGAIPSRRNRAAKIIRAGQRCTCGALAPLDPRLRTMDRARRKAARRAGLRHASLVNRALHAKRAITRNNALDVLLAERGRTA